MINHFYDAPHMGENWFTYPNLYAHMVQRFNSGSHFVEIGAWKGKSAAFMAVEIANSNKKIKFDCIDTWSDEGFAEQYRGQDIFTVFNNNMAPVADYVNAIRLDSVAASAQYEDNSLDFVFIDGDHSYAGCKRDILAYLPKMKPNSILAGHDYGWTPEIRQAVWDVFGENAYDDPWGGGCFILQIVDGVPKKF